jgi:hypothetical protein
MKKKLRIEEAYLKSVDQMKVFWGLTSDSCPSLHVVDHDGFFALAIQQHDLIVQISTECVSAVEQLSDNCAVNFSMEHALEWLILHELHHAALGHFELTLGSPVLHLVSRKNRETFPLNDLPKYLWRKVSPCLELQADHDAFEMMLGDYAVGDWVSVRKVAASIAAVMVLIETAGSGDGDNPSSHPHAATRIFQLLGHVVEMWSIPAHGKANARGEHTIRDEDLPTQVEIQAFSSEVVLPLFWDAVVLAKTAGAKSIISDLGSPEDFFTDIGRTKLGQWDELVTVGAKEWAALKDVNEAILPLLSINYTVN